MRSVHTLASVHAHRGGTSLPCLAIGTPGSFSGPCVSFTLPPSCPPWLHGRYPLHGYDGDSDSCPAPSSARAGLLGSPACTSGHSVSNHPMRPRLPAMLLAPGGLGQRFALHRYRQFFGLRSLLAVSSVASGRIEFVSQPSFGPLFYGLSVHFQLLSTQCRHLCSYFQLPAGSSAREGLSPSYARLLPSARAPASWPPTTGLGRTQAVHRCLSVSPCRSSLPVRFLVVF